jgi:hypothetical protein
LQLRLIREPEGTVEWNMAEFEAKQRAEESDDDDDDDDFMTGKPEHYKALAEHAALADDNQDLVHEIKGRMLTNEKIKEVLASYN